MKTKPFKQSALLLLLALAPACGQQLVEFDHARAKKSVGLAPFVTSTVPVAGASSVALGTAVSATFSEAMDPASIDGETFIVKQGTVLIAGKVAYDGLKATFTPSEKLAVNAIYFAKINTRAKSAGGKSIAADYTWSFSTSPASTLAPAVVSTDPAPGAIDVVLNKKISATFSKEMNPALLTDSVFTLKQGASDVSGVVTYVGMTATFSPASNLAENTLFTATISTGAVDTLGLALASDYSWSFTTGKIPDNKLPTILSTNPISNAVNVSINKRLTVTFSEAMLPASVTEGTFTVQEGMMPVTGTVSYNAGGNTATFTPAFDFALATTYTATMNTAAQDSAGNAMANNYTWNFETAACGMSTVPLGATDGFAVLGGSTVTNTGVLTSVTGDVGVSPGTAVTGFGPGQIVGDLHAGDVPAAAAMAALTTAYDDAAGRTLCPITIAGNIGGTTLTPGLYKSTSSLAVSSGELTLDAQGDPDAIFIFQMASTLTVTSGRQVILAGGAKASNIFWQVGTSATLGTTSSFQGTIMADQAISLLTGATLNGRALARIGAVTLDSSVVVKPAP